MKNPEWTTGDLPEDEGKGKNVDLTPEEVEYSRWMTQFLIKNPELRATMANLIDSSTNLQADGRAINKFLKEQWLKSKNNQ